MKTLVAAMLMMLALPALAADCEGGEDIFERLDCELRVSQKRLELAQTEDQRRTLEAGAGSGDADADGNRSPQLVRIYGRPGALHAQFTRGRSVFSAREGEAISDSCVLARIDASGAQLRCREGGSHWVRLSRGPSVPASSSTPAPAPIVAQETPQQ